MGKEVAKVNPERRRTRYAKEFKLEAVRALERGEKPATQLALELGIKRNQLYKWQAQLKRRGEDQSFRGPGRKSLESLSEVERLRRELRRVSEERQKKGSE
jgi:transposase